MTDILTRLQQASKINGAYPQDIKDAMEEIMGLRVRVDELLQALTPKQTISRIDIIGQNGNDGTHYTEVD